MIDFLNLISRDDFSSLDSDDERATIRKPKDPVDPQYCYCFAACPIYGTYYSIFYIHNFAQAQISDG